MTLDSSEMSEGLVGGDTSLTSPANDDLAGNGADEFSRRHFRWNATWLVIENAVFLVAIAFVGSTTVLPTFVTQLGGTATLVGLLATAQTAGWLLPQLLGAGLCAGKPRMLPYILVPLYIGRPVFLIVAAIAFFFGSSQPGLVLVVLYVAILVFFAADAIASVPWYELIGKTISPERRGRMLGTAQIVGGVGGMAAGAAVGWLLERPELPFPNNFALLFAISGAIFCANIVTFLFVREPAFVPPAGAGRVSPTAREFVATLWPILRNDANLVKLVGARLLFGVATATFPFYILFVQRDFALGQERLGLFLTAQVFGNLIGGLCVGWIADRIGTKPVMRLSAVAAAVVPATGLAMLTMRATSPDLLLAVGTLIFVLMGIVGSANMIGYINYLLEVAPLQTRSTYVGLFNTLAGMLIIIPPLAGWLLDATSFFVLFVATIVFAGISLVATFGLREPIRRG